MTEDEMVGWHHRHGFGQTLGVGNGQGGLVCSWGRKELDTTEQLNQTELNRDVLFNIKNMVNIYIIWGQMVARLFMMIISQSVQMFNHYIVNLKLTILYSNYFNKNNYLRKIVNIIDIYRQQQQNTHYF